MKKRLFAIIMAIALVCLVGCSAAKNGSDAELEYFSYSDAQSGGLNISYTGDYNYSMAEDGFDYVAEESTAEAPMEIAPREPQVQDNKLAGRKIVYSSNFVIHTKEYDASLTALEELCNSTGAYFESKNAYGGEDGRERRSNYTIRVPVENYKDFISSVGNVGTLISSSENNRDITEQYYDSEARLESALIREQRVLEILKNASKLDDILALERELSDIRYEIENLTGTLRKYDSLVSYCTVTMEIREKSEIVKQPAKVLTFGERVAKGFKSGIGNFVDGVQDFVIYLSYNLIGILFWLTVLIVGAVFVIRYRRRKKTQKKAKAPIETSAEEKTE